MHSTFKPQFLEDTIYNNSPASLRLITNSYQNNSGEEADKFGMSYIDFWSKSSNFLWKSAEIRTIDDNSGNYELINPNRTVKAGLAFHCAYPTLESARWGSREVFRIINGNMGVGSIDPVSKFEVQTDSHWSGTKVAIDQQNGDPSIRISRSTGYPICEENHRQAALWWIELNTDYQQYGEWDALQFKTGPVQCTDGNEVVQPKVVFTTAGNVGIGVTNPKQKLVVDGMICAKEVRVSLSGDPCWPDFVFADNYKLTSINELATFIKSNKHLPGIPTAEEIANNGVELVICRCG